MASSASLKSFSPGYKFLFIRLRAFSASLMLPSRLGISAGIIIVFSFYLAHDSTIAYHSTFFVCLNEAVSQADGMSYG
jgi:hypothetical protein